MITTAFDPLTASSPGTFCGYAPAERAVIVIVLVDGCQSTAPARAHATRASRLLARVRGGITSRWGGVSAIRDFHHSTTRSAHSYPGADRDGIRGCGPRPRPVNRRDPRPAAGKVEAEFTPLADDEALARRRKGGAGDSRGAVRRIVGVCGPPDNGRKTAGARAKTTGARR